MKKFALVSFYRSENYGAVLQAFALRHVLERMGVSSVYLEYDSKNRLRGLAYIKNRMNRLVRNLFGYKLRARRFREFVNNGIPHRPVDGTKYDGYIIGSDQVWHPDYLRDSDNFFFLPFVRSEFKYSYASSFGVAAIPVNLVDFYKENLRRLKLIGVREPSGLKILNQLGISGTVTPDPTLLMNRFDWSLYVAPRIEKDPYIFCYVMQGDNETANYVRKVASKLQRELVGRRKIIVMGDKEFKAVNPMYNLVCDAGPKEFLSYIVHADYVITSSFHGTCFSLNFNRPFKVVLRRDNTVNSRIIDLLSFVELSTLISYTDDSLDSVSYVRPDYSKINTKLLELRTSGIEFLKSIVNDA